MTSGGGARSHELLDFTLERSRHEHFFGRDDALAELDRLVAKKPAGFVLVLGGPGMGKSALLSRWLDLRGEGGKTVPHHFIRRGDRGRDEPEIVRANLAAQIERLYPAQRDEGASPERRLDELLARVSERVLAPAQTRLVVLVDGLDEAAARDERDNPVARILPFRLPKGVVMVCASRPTYPHLGWFKPHEQLVRPALDLDQPAWSTSNDAAVRAFWAYHVARDRFSPALSGELVAAAIGRARGNLLYAVKLAEWLDDAPAEARKPTHLPAGLEDLLDELWRRLQALPAAESECVRQGLGLLAVAREALPARCLEAALGWPPGAADARLLGTAARQVLLEEPAAWHGGVEKRYRLYHESFAELVRSKLAEALPGLHRRMGEQIAAWPHAATADDFRRRYALRHAIAHRRLAGGEEDDWRALYRLCLDVGYLVAAAGEVGVSALEAELEQAASSVPDHELAGALADVRGGIAGESHRLRSDPRALPGLLWNQLRCRNWSEARLENEVQWPPGEPGYRLRHPLQQIELSAKIFFHEARPLPSHAPVAACAFTPNGLRVLSAAIDGTLQLWDVESGREIARLCAGRDAVYACALASNGTLALSAGRSVHLWDLEAGRELQRFDVRGDMIAACALTPDGRRALLGSTDGTLRAWDLERPREVARFKAKGTWIVSCALTADGRRALSGSDDGTLQLWDLESGRELPRPLGHQGSIRSCAFTHDGRRVLTGSYDGTLRLWEVEGGRKLLRLEGHTGGVAACAISPDDAMVLSGSQDNTLRLWSLREAPRPRPPAGHHLGVDGCDLTPDGALALTGSCDGTLYLWEVESGRKLARMAVHHGGAINACALTPDGERALVAGHSLELWAPKVGSKLLRLEGHDDLITACALAPDGRRALSGSVDRTLRLWDLEHGRELRRLVGHEERIRACAFTPDGTRALSGSYDGTLRVWSLSDGRELLRLEGHRGWIIACAVTPDGKRAVSSSRDRTARVWDLESGDELLCLEGHTDWVNACAVTPDGARVVTGSDDRTLRVWDLQTGQPLATVYGLHQFRSVAASQRGIVAGDEAGNVWFLTDRPLRRALRNEPAVKPRPPTETASLRFLHLTDWHVGMAEQGWLWPNVREAFFDDLARLHQQLGGFDAIFFTGDLTQRGSEAEFARLDEGLAALWRRLAELGSDPVLVAVPGNHDLQRPPPKGAVVKALGTWHADPDVRDALWSEAEGDYRQGVRNAFAPYAAWAERHPAMQRARPQGGVLPGDVSAVVERGGLRVGVVGLNSAFLQLTGADYDKRLDLDVRQLHAACGGDAPAWLAQNDLNLLLTHHPPAWLEPARRKAHFETEIAPPGRFALHLHGHMHEPAAHAEAIGGSRPRHRLQGPSLFGLERFEGPGGAHEERIHGYTAGRIELRTEESRPEGKAGATVRLWPRRLVTKRSGARVMERDGEFELEGDESFRFEVPCQRRATGLEPSLSKR